MCFSFSPPLFPFSDGRDSPLGGRPDLAVASFAFLSSKNENKLGVICKYNDVLLTTIEAEWRNEIGAIRDFLSAHKAAELLHVPSRECILERAAAR